MSYLYDNRLPFSSILKDNLDDQRARVKERRASLIIIDGFLGNGKTTLAVHCADYLNKIAGYQPIIFSEQLGMGGDKFQKALRTSYEKRYPTSIYDEAGDFNKRGALTKFNAALNRTFETYRAFQIIPILCLPNFSILDNELFNKGIPRLLIHVDNRTTQGNFRAYGLYRMFYIKKKMEKLTVKPQAYDLTQPSFYGHFKDLPPTRSAELDRYSTTGKYKLLLEAEKETAGLHTLQDLTEKTGRSSSRLRALIKKLKIKPETIIKQKKYYPKRSLNRLQNHLYNQPGKSWIK